MAAVCDGARVCDISRAVQTYVESFGYGVVRDLVGHGIGQGLHEDPKIPNFVGGGFQDVVLQEGMVICIEPMVTAGGFRVTTLEDGWTVATVDGSLGAHFEHTLAVTKKGYELLTV
jgi:methionyl aminopeptidase